jgi:glycosyltransferase involved in cell wall biosynthesis
MRILQVVSYFFPAWAYGGPVKVAYETSKELVRRGHDVTVYTTDVYDRHSRVRVRKNVPVAVDGVRRYYFRNISDILAYKLNFFLTPQLVPVMRREIASYDVIHLIEYFTFQNIVTRYYAVKHHIPYVVTAHGSLDPVKLRQKWILKRLFTYIFGRRVLRDAGKAIALTQSEKQQLVATGVPEKRVVVIPNGIDPAEFETLPSKGGFRAKYGVGEGERIILFVGRIQRIKGLELLLEALYYLSHERDDIRLVLVGSEEEGHLATLMNLADSWGIRDKVLHTGLLTDADKLSAYADADVFVLPSHGEGFPMTILEACASGAPVVITEQCNVPEVADYDAGFVIKRNRDDLRTAILQILDDPALQKRLGDHGKKMVRDRFTWNKVVTQLEVVYREVRARNAERW